MESYPEKSYAVIEIVCNQTQHTHLKGSKGGIRISIDNYLKELQEIKVYLIEQSKTLRGPLIDLFSKNIQPIVQMAQALVHQPVEAFLGGFTSVIPHKLACYQKKNSEIKKKLLEDFKFEKNDSLSTKIEKMLKYWVQIDCNKRMKLIDKIPFNLKKNVVGYIQQFNIYQDNKWSCVCFSEAQLLALMADLKTEPAILWDGTDPNTKRKDDALLFPLLTRSGYGSFNRKNEMKLYPCKVVARLFTNIRDYTPQVDLFDLLIEKSKLYSTKPLDFSEIVLITDMDPMINQIVAKYNMKHWWDRRHVNQSIVRHLREHPLLNFVLVWMKEIRDSETKEKADAKIEDLRVVLTTKTIKGIKNEMYDEKVWEYLNRIYFCHLDKLCR
jgi:hypothetical protein